MNNENTTLLPVLSALPALRRAMTEGRFAVLTAATGAGKSTGLPYRLLDEPFLDGKSIVMLEPRRLAAKLVSRRLAENLGEPVGQRVGYVMRGESCRSADTRLLVVTEGVLTRMLQADPELNGVGMLIFDEFHERSLAADLGLALALDSARSLRGDLRILIMSATLAGERIAGLLGGNTPVIDCPGRLFPVEERYGEPGLAERDVPPAVARAVLAAVEAGCTGGILAFLPGAPEIVRTQEILRTRLDESVLIAPLYGAMDKREQDLAVLPAPDGKIKVVLATNIAESSITIDGVSTVIDCGYEKRQEFDPGRGMPALKCRRISRNSAVQRAGRAGRTGPGAVRRLYSKIEFEHFRQSDVPEILNCDLSRLVLELAQWGAPPERLAWLDAPPEVAWELAQKRLKELGVLNPDGSLSGIGRYCARLPLPVRLGVLLYHASRRGLTSLGCELAALLEENRGGAEPDIERQLEECRKRPGRTYKQLLEQLYGLTGCRGERQPAGKAASLIALAFPEFVAVRRNGAGGGFLLASGRGARLPENDDLARAEFLAAARLDGGGENAKIWSGIAYSEAQLRHDFASAIVERVEEEFDGRRFTAFAVERFGAIELDRRRLPTADTEASGVALAAFVAKNGLEELKMSASAARLIQRVRFARRLDETYPDWSGEKLLSDLDKWLLPYLAQVRSLEALQALDHLMMLKNHLGRELLARLDAEFPDNYTTPCGSMLRINYEQDAPALSVPVGEMYGVRVHPAVGRKKLPLRIELLNPARRPVQTTSDLPGFWQNNWKLVQKELKSTYPKHYWPDHPELEIPMRRSTKKSRGL